LVLDTLGGICLDQSFCSFRGRCIRGRCVCQPPYKGVTCEVGPQCLFWDPNASTWSSEGVTSAILDLESPTPLLQCNSTHLTEFGGLSVPTSADELLSELQDIQVVVPDAAAMLAAFCYECHPLLWQVIFSLVAANVLVVPLFRWRYRRRLVKQVAQVAAAGEEGGKQAEDDTSSLQPIWFYADGGSDGPKGPISKKELVSMRENGVPIVLVWTEGMAEWSSFDKAIPPALELKTEQPVEDSDAGKEPMERPKSREAWSAIDASESKVGTADSHDPVEQYVDRLCNFYESPRAAWEDPTLSPADAMGASAPATSPADAASASASAPSLAELTDSSSSSPSGSSFPGPQTPSDSTSVAAPAAAATTTTDSDPAEVADASSSAAPGLRRKGARLVALRFLARKSTALEVVDPDSGSAAGSGPKTLAAVARLRRRVGGGSAAEGVAEGADAQPDEPEAQALAEGAQAPAKPKKRGLVRQLTSRRACVSAEEGEQAEGGAQAPAKPKKRGLVRQLTSRRACVSAEGGETEAEATERKRLAARGRWRKIRVARRHQDMAEDVVEAMSLAARLAALARKKKEELTLWLWSKKAVQLLIDREWKLLAKHLRWETFMLAVRRSRAAVDETRERHSIVSLATPLTDWDDDPQHLRDEQTAVIFITVILYELLGTFMWWRTSEVSPKMMTETAAPAPSRRHLKVRFTGGQIYSDADYPPPPPAPPGEMVGDSYWTKSGGGARIMTVLIKSLAIGLMCILVATWVRLVFRFGNKYLHRAHESRRMAWLAYIRLAVAWFLNETLYALSLWVAAGYGRFLTAKETKAALLDWIIGTSVAWFMIEPAQIVVITLLPCIFKSGASDKLQEWLSMCGLDLSFFF